MARSSSTWALPRGRSPLRDYWRGRESAWRRFRIRSPWRPNEQFNRYDYARLWREQKGLCGLCSKPFRVKVWMAVDGNGEVGTGRGIDVDHARSHGQARALLHGQCNRWVSSMDSNHALMVLNYLLKHEGRTEVAGLADY